MNPKYKSRYVKTLMKLSRASGLYPECLILKGVDMEEVPVAQGSYGDVHKGLLQGKKVAVKVLRIYQDSNREKLLKVSNCRMFNELISAIFPAILVRGRIMATAFPPKCIAFLWGVPSRRENTQTLFGLPLDGQWQFPQFPRTIP